MKFIVLDSYPLALLTQSPNVAKAAERQQWFAGKMVQGMRAVFPEIVDYELRRELVRARKGDSIRRLDEFIADPAVTFLRITTLVMRLAAELWANARQHGRPTADVHALDVDVILAAHVLDEGFAQGEFVVATSNVSHLSQFLPAEIWSEI